MLYKYGDDGAERENEIILTKKKKKRRVSLGDFGVNKIE